MFDLKSKFETTKDMSFSNLLFKNFVIRLVILAICSLPIITIMQSILVESSQNKIEQLVSTSTLEIVQILDSEIPEDDKSRLIKQELADTQNNISSHKMTKSASLIAYNLSVGELIEKSRESIVFQSDELYEWWKKQTHNTTNSPIIKISDEMLDFCRNNNDKKIVATNIYCVNGVLMPETLSIQTSHGNASNSITMQIPSISTTVYDASVELDLIGNKSDDQIYAIMSNYLLIPNNESQTFEVQYQENNINKFQVSSHDFINNNVKYQVDCFYQINFWEAYLIYILLFELLAILICFGLSFIAAKSSTSFYH